MSNFTADKFTWFKQISRDRRNLPPMAAWVAVVLCEYFNNGNKTAWSSISRLACDLQAGERTIQRAIGALAERGYLEVETGGACKEGRYRSNHYRLILKPSASNGESSSDPGVSKSPPLEDSLGVSAVTPLKPQQLNVSTTASLFMRKK
jgi:hypothetical protein